MFETSIKKALKVFVCTRFEKQENEPKVPAWEMYFTHRIANPNNNIQTVLMCLFHSWKKYIYWSSFPKEVSWQRAPSEMQQTNLILKLIHFSCQNTTNSKLSPVSLTSSSKRTPLSHTSKQDLSPTPENQLWTFWCHPVLVSSSLFIQDSRSGFPSCSASSFPMCALTQSSIHFHSSTKTANVISVLDLNAGCPALLEILYSLASVTLHLPASPLSFLISLHYLLHAFSSSACP